MSKNSEKNFVIRHKNIDINIAVKKNRLDDQANKMPTDIQVY